METEGRGLLRFGHGHVHSGIEQRVVALPTLCIPPLPRRGIRTELWLVRETEITVGTSVARSRASLRAIRRAL